MSNFAVGCNFHSKDYKDCKGDANSNIADLKEEVHKLKRSMEILQKQALVKKIDDPAEAMARDAEWVQRLEKMRASDFAPIFEMPYCHSRGRGG